MDSASISFEALIIILVIISTAIVGGVASALYWLWRMLKYDLRETHNYLHEQHECARGLASPQLLAVQRIADSGDRSDLRQQHADETEPLTSKANDAGIVVRPAADEGATSLRTSLVGCDDVRTIRLESQDSRWSIPDGWTLEEVVIVLDGTEPPPPYGADSVRNSRNEVDR